MLLVSKASFVRCSINLADELLTHFFLGSYWIKSNCGGGKEEILVLECSSDPDLLVFFSCNNNKKMLKQYLKPSDTKSWDLNRVLCCIFFYLFGHYMGVWS